MALTKFRENLEKFVIRPDASIFEALRQIDKNKHGFLVVLGQDNKVLGTLTDGDIRRALIAGRQIEEPVNNIYNRNMKTIGCISSISDVTEIFKNESIKFLPVVDDDGALLNLITKRQVYSMLLQDISADLTYDFMSLDENMVDYEIFHRPWGFYRTTVMNDYFQSKVISVKPKSQLSLQSHNRREEHWIVAHGSGIVQIGESKIEARCGMVFFIPKGVRHRLINTDDKKSLIVTEVQIGDYFGEDDIIRYEDMYGRVTSGIKE